MSQLIDDNCFPPPPTPLQIRLADLRRPPQPGAGGDVRGVRGGCGQGGEREEEGKGEEQVPQVQEGFKGGRERTMPTSVMRSMMAVTMMQWMVTMIVVLLMTVELMMLLMTTLSLIS